MKIAPGVRVGPYEVMEQVGKGGMATVFKAYHHALERMVAIKVLPDFLAEDPEFRERFRREAIAIARLRHPNILAVYDHGEFDGQPYIVTEFVDGGTFAHELGTPLAMPRAVEVLHAIASALDYAHEQGVLHRDVKPSNVLMTKDGKSVLGDFGLARMMAANQRLTRLDMVVGTPEYMSPEQCSGVDSGPPSDQYSLGVVAFEALTGHPPFHAETPAAVMLAQMRTPLPAPHTVNPNLPPAVDAALMRALAKEPGDRFPSCVEFVDALTPAAATAVVAATAVDPPAAQPVATAPVRAQPPARSRPPVGIAAAALAALLIVGGVAYALTQSSLFHHATTPAGAVTTVPRHGSLIYDAAIGKAAWAGGEPSPDPSGAVSYGYKGSIDLRVQKEGSLSAEFDAPALKNYVSDMVFHVDAGSDFTVDWSVRGEGPSDDASVYLHIDVPNETVTLVLSPNNAENQALTATLAVPGLQSGKTFDFGIVVNGSSIALYVDGKQIGAATQTRANGATTPQFYLDGKSGALHIQSLRYYAVP